jgi:hypothetical protein
MGPYTPGMACTCPAADCEAFVSLYPLSSYDHQECVPDPATGKCNCTCYLNFPIFGVQAVGGIGCPLPGGTSPSSGSDTVAVVVGGGLVAVLAIILVEHHRRQAPARA